MALSMLIISYDAVGDKEFERLMEYPTFSAFSKQAAIYREVPTIYVSNTYPVHTSIVTGVMPKIHGLKSNTEPFPMKCPVWNFAEDHIRVKTLWQAAAEKRIKTAAVFWPVTAFSKTIKYNIPEILHRPGENQLITSLRAGSKCLQIRMFIRHGRLLTGISQPSRDNFAATCMADILRKNKPGLALIHLTVYDTLCHKHGNDAGALKAAYDSLDRNLALLLEAADADSDVILFSDHSQINLHTDLEPNTILVNAGLMSRENDAWIPGESGCYIECCGGSAFFHAGDLSAISVEYLRDNIENSEGFRRFLTYEEMIESGYERATFGFCAQAGYSYVAFPQGHKADHGYPTDMPDYKVFYMVRGCGLQPGSVAQGGSLLNIAPLAAQRLGLQL